MNVCMYIVYLSGHPVYTFIHDNKREQRQNRQVSVHYYGLYSSVIYLYLYIKNDRSLIFKLI